MKTLRQTRLGSLKYLTGLIVFVVVLLNQGPTYASTIEKKPEEYWKDTPLSFGLLKSFLLQENCYATKEKFIGCIHAVNVVGSYSDPAQTLATPEMVQTDPSSYGNPTKAFGVLSIVERLTKKTNDTESILKVWLSEKAKKDLEIYAYSQIFESGKAPQVDFGAIVDYLAQEIAKDGKEGMIAAGAINVYYASAIDPHTHINPLQELLDQSVSTGSSFVGIGVTLQSLGGKIILGSPMPGSPALKSGLKAKDIIVSIDGNKTDGMALQKVVELIRGPKGTAVTLTVSRKGEILVRSVIRDQIVVSNVASRVVADRGIKYGYIKLNSFMEGTSCSEISAGIKNLIGKKVKGLIFDLRGNGGGRLEQSTCIGGLFLGANKVVAQVKDLDTDLMIPQLSPQGVSLTTDLPMVTLIDAGSASASEILAGALQDYKRSWVAGSRSFGKATVQGGSSWEMGGQTIDGVIIFRTIQRFYQPSGRTNQVVGIEPDFAIDPKPNATDEERFSLRESDLYSNYLPPVGPPWKQSRPAKVKRIETCVAATGKAKQLYAQRAEDAISPDYQLLSAQDILACDAK